MNDSCTKKQDTLANNKSHSVITSLLSTETTIFSLHFFEIIHWQMYNQIYLLEVRFICI